MSSRTDWEGGEDPVANAESLSDDEARVSDAERLAEAEDVPGDDEGRRGKRMAIARALRRLRLPVPIPAKRLAKSTRALLSVPVHLSNPTKVAIVGGLVIAVAVRSRRKRVAKKSEDKAKADAQDGLLEKSTRATPSMAPAVEEEEEEERKVSRAVPAGPSSPSLPTPALPSGDVASRTTQAEPEGSIVTHAVWENASLFLVAVVSILEASRHLDMKELALQVGLVLVYEEAIYKQYVLNSEKLLMLLLAWILTIRVTLSVLELRRNQTACVETKELPSEVPPTRKIDFAGSWVKDKKRSDSLSETMKIAHIPFLLRKAIILVGGSEISMEGGELKLTVHSVVPWFKIRETYSLKEATYNKRRDLRKGKMKCLMKATRTGFKFKLSWPEPFGGYELTTWDLVDNEMHVSAEVHIRDQVSKYVQIYKRSV